MDTLTVEKTFHVEGMDCASCALKLEQSVAQLDGIELVEVSFAGETLRVAGRFEPDAVAARVHALGYQVASGPRNTPRPEAGSETLARYLWSDRTTVVALIGAVLLLLSVPLALLPDPGRLTWLVRGLHVTTVLLTGYAQLPWGSVQRTSSPSIHHCIQ